MTAAGVIGSASQAQAALYYYPDSEPGFSRPAPTVQPRRPKTRHLSAKKIEAPAKESSKPQNPLIISVSISKQTVKIYDANGVFAEAPVSTGMPGHPTPMGVFSVIGKEKMHHSNIYSGAPMPFMERITWSGVAMHAGVLPGHPASHGCIRMPMAFAVKMYGWTRMGARVFVTPGDVTPASFSHPLLVAQKVVPKPAGADEPQADAPSAPTKTDKGANADTTIRPTTSEAALELRSTVGHFDPAKPIASETPDTTPLRDQTHTADASNSLPPKGAVTMSDAAPGASGPSPREDAFAGTAPPIAREAASADDKAAETKLPDAATAEAKPAEVGASGKAATETEEAKTPAQPGDDAKAETTAVPASAPDAKKDQTRLPDAEQPVAPKPVVNLLPAAKPNSQIAVFISRKDQKLYVRQNFAPLFSVPVTIAPSDRPLGTHVFTAQLDKDDANLLHWSVVSLPVSLRAERRDADERVSRKRKVTTGTVEMKPMPVPDSPTEALDRITIPADAMARITEALSTGSSIIVSDQGIAAGETGEGTDFIVSLR